MSELTRNIMRFLSVFLIQVFLMNQIQLFGVAYPFIYIIFVLFLPIRIPNWATLIIAFVCGFLIDIFHDSLGLHTAAITLVAFVRPFILRRLTPQYTEEDDAYIDIYNRSIPQFMIYAFLSALLFCVVYFLLERFSSNGLFTVILQIIGSTLLTFVVMVIYRYLFMPASLKN